VRIETRLLKLPEGPSRVNLDDLLEGVAPHPFEGKSPFEAETPSQIRELKKC